MDGETELTMAVGGVQKVDITPLEWSRGPGRTCSRVGLHPLGVRVVMVTTTGEHNRQQAGSSK